MNIIHGLSEAELFAHLDKPSEAEEAEKLALFEGRKRYVRKMVKPKFAVGDRVLTNNMEPGTIIDGPDHTGWFTVREDRGGNVLQDEGRMLTPSEAIRFWNIDVADNQ